MSETQLKELENIGIGRFGVRPERLGKTPRTIVVIGPGRSGTSMVAGALQHLGVFMGKHARGPIFEDSHLDLAVGGKRGQLQSLLGDYNQRYPVWGYKRPQVAIKNLNTIHKYFRNPIYVLCFRDAFAVANRNRISAGSDLVVSMRGALDAYEKMIAFLASKNPYALLVSYDKAVRSKRLFLDELVDFCGLELSAERKSAALDFISESPKDYLLYSDRTREMPGFLDSVSVEAVKGWARPESGKPAEVVLYIGGKEIARTQADKSRADLRHQEGIGDLRCGFEFSGFEPGLVDVGVEVRVKTAVRGEELVNSPLVVDSRRSEECPGFLDAVSTESVSGWAKSVAGGPAEVVLHVDGVEIARTLADKHRLDLEGQQCYRAGCCAFDFVGFDAPLIRQGAEIRVTIARDSIELTNSPFVVPG